MQLPSQIYKAMVYREACKTLFRRILSTTFCFLLSALISSLPKSMAMGGGGPYEGLKDAARKTVVAVETPASSGSGVVIGQKGNKYYFITARHVIQGDPTKEEYFVYITSNGAQRYRVTSIETPHQLRDFDIAIGSFVSTQPIDKALIFPLDKSEGILVNVHGDSSLSVHFGGSTDDWVLQGRPWKVIKQDIKYNWIAYKSMNGRTYDKIWFIQGPPIIAGVSIPTNAIPVPVPRFSSAELLARVTGNKDGYEIVYNASSTVPGMSGGGVFAARVCPSLIVKEGSLVPDLGLYAGIIAMHGRSEEYGVSGSRSGVSLGIPLALLSDYFIANSDRYGIPVGNEYKTMVLAYCINGSFDK